MRAERLAGDPERDVGAFSRREEVPEMPAQVGRRRIRPGLGVPRPPDGDVAPDAPTPPGSPWR